MAGEPNFAEKWSYTARVALYLISAGVIALVLVVASSLIWLGSYYTSNEYSIRANREAIVHAEAEAERNEGAIRTQVEILFKSMEETKTLAGEIKNLQAQITGLSQGQGATDKRISDLANETHQISDRLLKLETTMGLLNDIIRSEFPSGRKGGA